ncbi:MAG: DinB family protein [Candidatus Eisenbacteria bacterium]|uniref:DinB family protein n=1 Tax=Eiseniibacteriota bacterium TaxID=2212470 RepID=A0A933SB24_UNCEI|nr:DinB family protein [Candidatus Eisenbacteria bacterium]
MASRELETFLATWSFEAQRNAQLMRALPEKQYDYRPQPEWRSIGELAWHLAEGDGYMAAAVATGAFDFGTKLPGLERPRTIAELAPAYERVHADAIAKVRAMKPEALDEKMPGFDGQPIRKGDVLWSYLLHHNIHHRGELVLMCRMAGGTPPGLYGPNREETQAMMAARAKG